MNRKKLDLVYSSNPLTFAPPTRLSMQGYFFPYANLYPRLTMVDLPSFLKPNLVVKPELISLLLLAYIRIFLENTILTRENDCPFLCFGSYYD
jgi:hypothetical protein